MDENKIIETGETEQTNATESKETKEKSAKKAKLVEVFVPRGSSKGDSSVQIGINGKNYLLPRGKKSVVPPEVAAEYERSVKAEDVWHDKKAGMTTKE